MPPEGKKGPNATYTRFRWVVAGAYPTRKKGESSFLEVQKELKKVQQEASSLKVTDEAKVLARRDACPLIKFGELETVETAMLSSNQRLEKLITEWIEAERFDPVELKNTKTVQEEYIKEKLKKGGESVKMEDISSHARGERMNPTSRTTESTWWKTSSDWKEVSTGGTRG